jgi:NADH-quinone oxidoreductase subunit L
LSASIAVTQTDLKRVLAYSTVSQLGYMFMALGAGVGSVAQLAIVAAMFHLFTHAFFKALLFLSAGSVMHAMGDVIDMRRFRGLRDRLPYTCLTFAVGGLALSGIFPLSGFFSKDEILLALRLASHDGGWIYLLIYWVAVLTAFMTAFYTGRAFFMTFWGPLKLPSPDDPEAPRLTGTVDAHTHADPVASDQSHGDAHAHAHDSHIGRESPPIMIYPLYALAGCTVLIGLVCLLAGPFWGTAEWFAHHLHATFRFESLQHEEHHFDWLTALIGTVAGVGGLALSYFLYAEPSPIPTRLIERFGPLYEASLHKFRVDEAYEFLVVRPTRALAIVCDFIDAYVVDGLVIAVSKLPRRIGRDVLARYQNGLIQFYAAVSALSVVFLLVFFLVLQTMGF